MKDQFFSSRLASVLTFLGVAIGLGNVWRFPYMMGRYGGSAFLAVYLIFTILFAFPALMAEMSLGRMSGKGTVNALRLGFGSRIGPFLGYLLLVVVTVAGSYYAVVVANVVFTTGYSVVSGFSTNSTLQYNSLLGNGWLQYGITLFLIVSSLFLIDKGLVAGIERVSKIFMPFFFLALMYMIAHALSMPQAIARCMEFLRPDMSVLGLKEIFAALGQAFFSVGLGGTFVVVYAGFLRKDENIASVAFFTGLGDAGASLLISLFLIPSILVFGLDMNSGPGLIFQTFPRLFEVMPGGRFVGSLFLLSVAIVAFLSLVAAYQVPFTSIQFERPKIAPRKILVCIGLLQAVLALPSSLFPGIIGQLDLIFGSGMQVLGSAFCILGLTWGINKSTVFLQLFGSAELTGIRRFTFVWIKWLIPLALFAALAGYVYDVISQN